MSYFLSPSPTPHSAPLLIGKRKAPTREGVKNILVTGGAGYIGLMSNLSPEIHTF